MEIKRIGYNKSGDASSKFGILIAIFILVLLTLAAIYFIKSGEKQKVIQSNNNVESQQLTPEDNSLIDQEAQTLNESDDIDLGELI